MIDNNGLKTLFTQARSHNGWLDKPITTEQIQQIYDLLKFAPTSANCSPVRITFITSDNAKQRLKPHLDTGNIEKSMTAPATAIIAYDEEFYEKLPQLFPHNDARSWFVGHPEKITQAGTSNATLQAAYFMIAARSIGLDCGPIIGFDAQAVDKEFFANAKTKTLMICNIGYGDSSKLHPRSPRLDFDQACEII